MDTGILPIADRVSIASPQSTDSLAIGKPNSENSVNTSSSTYSTPDVQVHLSKLGRQLSIESMEKETVQNTQASEKYQAESSLIEKQTAESNQQERSVQNNSSSVNHSRLEHDETLDIGTQEEARFDQASRSILDINDRTIRTASHEVTETNRIEVRDQSDARREENSEISEAINTAKVVELATSPNNTSQSASVATQYNISPESALGHSISTFA